MNKLIIVGNGFDLAHGLPTSFSHFILDHINSYWKYFLKDGYIETDLLQINKGILSLKLLQKTIDNLDQISDLLRKNEVRLTSNNLIVQHLIHNNLNLRWVDLEMTYFHLLSQVLGDQRYSRNQSLTSDGITYVDKLNKDLNDLQMLFISYLEQDISTIEHRTFHIDYIRLFSPEEPELGHSASTILILNFNYTDTVQNYILSFLDPSNPLHLRQKVRTYNLNLINIHGSIHDNQNQIIFGFGDEIDSRYKELEKLNYNGLLKNAKTFGYFHSENYSNLLNFINNNYFEVEILGHSCGISDRTLLSEIFQSQKCQKINIYYHNNIDNFNNLTYEISRHFEDNKMMRKKVSSINYAKRTPQVVKGNCYIRPKYSLDEVYSINNNEEYIDW